MLLGAEMSMPWTQDQTRDAQTLEGVMLEYWKRHDAELMQLQKEQERNMKGRGLS